MKTQHPKCQQCGERFTYIRMGQGRPPIYCPSCIEERKREQARLRMQAMRERRSV
jgi:predicted nucleic acid-binding Zn ribbon protein